MQLPTHTGNIAFRKSGVFNKISLEKLAILFNEIFEVDFLIEKDGKVLPLEIKSGADYRKHAALDNLMRVQEFSLEKANIYSTSPEIEEGRQTYLPIYALMFLSHDAMPENLIYKLDL